MKRLALVLVAGCGRIAFDERTDGGAVRADSETVASLRPLAWWKLDEMSGTTAKDSVGMLDGTLAPGTAGLPTWAAVGGNDPNDYALYFNGTGDTVDFGSPSVLANLPAVSVAGWLYPIQVDVISDRCLFDKGTSGVSGAGWVASVGRVASGALSFSVYGPGSTEMIAATDPNAISAAQWTHVVMTWDGTMNTTGIHIFVNGAEAAIAMQLPGASSRGDDSFVFAAINCVAAVGMNGMADDVILFDRVLTPAEVAVLYGS